MQPQPESEPQHKKGKTVLKKVGATRQLSSQASLPLIPSEQSWKQTIGLPEEKRSKRETEAFIMNQMLTHYQHKASRKIPGGCTQPATGMPSESARIVKVDAAPNRRHKPSVKETCMPRSPPFEENMHAP